MQKAELGVAVVGDSATQLLSDAIRGEAYLRGLTVSVYDADYDSVAQQLIDERSEVYKSKPAYIIIYLSVEKLYNLFSETLCEDRPSFANNIAGRIETYWQKIGKFSSAEIIQYTYIEKNDGVFGSYALSVPESFLYQVKKLNLLLTDLAASYKNAHLLDLNGIATLIGYDNMFSPQLYDMASLTLATGVLPRVAKQTIDIILSARGVSICKCVVLDLDNTLWGGVIGDDGMGGIELGDLGSGKAYVRFQRWLKELTYRGVLLCVCSKNDERNAKQPFEEHPDMVLKLSDITVFVANWQDKASNISAIRETLNIGMNSIAFIDDNAFERELVKSKLKDVIVPDMPKDPSEYVSYLQSLNLFEAVSYSREDRVRAEMYRSEAERRKVSAKYDSIDDFLKDLDMISDYSPFAAFDYPRIVQLSQRSNQFNLRTIRYTEDEIAKIASDKSYVTLQFNLKDRFGDHGLISVVIMKSEGDALFVETWLMSCRVLKRGMEAFVLNTAVETAKRLGYKKVIGEYIPTAKNAMVADVYENHGFTAAGDNRYVADVQKFDKLNTFIKGHDNAKK
ncbi:MAG: HAD-IIIC family phosphatase [Clostridia bacterium]|nr:HAD-IIIC family phosphatase [Clostridia bacterium]